MKHNLLAFVVLACTLGCFNGSEPNSETVGGTSNDISVADSDSSYENPVDGQTISPPGGWKTYTPEGGVRRSRDRIQKREIRLLTGQNAVAERITVDLLVDFINRIEKTAQTTLDSSTGDATIVAEFSCIPGSFSVELAHKGALSKELLSTLRDDLSRLQPLEVSKDEVVFQVTIDVANGG